MKSIVHFPTAIQHAFRGLLFLAGKPAGKVFNAEEIATSENLPADFLSKIFHRLASAKLVRSKRGPGGGYTLLKPAEKIRLAEVVEVLINLEFEERECLLGLGPCGTSEICPLHLMMKNTEKKVFEILNKATLKDLQNRKITM